MSVSRFFRCLTLVGLLAPLAVGGLLLIPFPPGESPLDVVRSLTSSTSQAPDSTMIDVLQQLLEQAKVSKDPEEVRLRYRQLNDELNFRKRQAELPALWEEAIRWYEAHPEADPYFMAQAWRDLGHSHFNAGRFDLALAAYARAEPLYAGSKLKLAPENHRGVLESLQVLEKMGHVR